MERIWLNSYPSGVPADIDVNEYRSLVDVLEEATGKFTHNTAFISMGKKITYKELDEKSLAFAAWLQSQGLKPGMRVGLMMPNILQYPIALFGILRAGGTVVNFNPMYTTHEVEHQIKDSGCEIMVVVENFAYTLQKALPNTPSVKKVVVASIGGLLGFKGTIVTSCSAISRR